MGRMLTATTQSYGRHSECADLTELLPGPFKDAQLRALGTLIYSNLLLIRKYWFPGYDLPHGLFPAHTDRKIRRTCAWVLIPLKISLYYAVF